MSANKTRTPNAAHVHRFTDEEVAAMLKRGACMCGIEDAERYPNDHGRFVVPTSPNCEVHRGA